jgi:hypothetical protein
MKLEILKRRSKLMRIKTNVRAGRIALNHNQSVKRLRIKSNVKACRIALNHNQFLAR